MGLFLWLKKLWFLQAFEIWLSIGQITSNKSLMFFLNNTGRSHNNTWQKNWLTHLNLVQKATELKQNQKRE